MVSYLILHALCSNIRAVQFPAFDLGAFFAAADFDFAFPFALGVFFTFPLDVSAFGAGVAKLSKIIFAAALAAAPLGNPPFPSSDVPFFLACLLAQRVSDTSDFKLWTWSSVNTLAWRLPSTLCVFRGNFPSWAREGARISVPEGVADGGVRFT